MNGRAINLLLLLAAALIVILPLALVHADFAGSDDRATAAIAATGYQPWFTPIWKPPSTEVESLLFALQAAMGAGVLGYVLGRLDERKGRATRTEGGR